MPYHTTDGGHAQPAAPRYSAEDVEAAERSLVGLAILRPEAIDDVGDLRGRDYADAGLGRLWDALAILRIGGIDMRDLAVLVPELRRMDLPPEITSAASLAVLMRESGYIASAPYYADIIRDAALRRRIRDVAARAHDATGNGQATSDILAALTVGVAELTRGGMATRRQSLGELVRDHPTLADPVIDGLLRRGETANIIAPPKYGKSWLTYGLALSVATGRDWLDTYPCAPGRVLLLDNELQPATLVQRIPRVAEAMGIIGDDYRRHIDVVSLRGLNVDLYGLADELRGIEAGRYALVIADAWYRFVPAGLSENDNAAVMRLYNLIDGYSAQLGAAWVNIHHASKGDQSSKGVTDMGAGAGAQSRAADTHIVLRAHEDDGVTVMEAAIRSFAPVEPVSLRWTWPVWTRADDADPRRLRRPTSERQRRQAQDDEAGIGRIVAALYEHHSGTTRQLRGWTGLSRERCQRLLDTMQYERRVTIEDGERGGNPCVVYALASPIDEADTAGGGR